MKSCFNCIHGFQDETLKASRELLCTLEPKITHTYSESDMVKGIALQDIPPVCMFHNLEGLEVKKAANKKKAMSKALIGEE